MAKVYKTQGVLSRKRYSPLRTKPRWWTLPGGYIHVVSPDEGDTTTWMNGFPCPVPCGIWGKKAIWWLFPCIARMVFVKQRQYGKGAPTANVSPFPPWKQRKTRTKESLWVRWSEQVSCSHFVELRPRQLLELQLLSLKCSCSSADSVPPRPFGVQPYLRAVPSAPGLGVAPLSLSAPKVCSHTGEKVRCQHVGGKGAVSAGVDGDSAFTGESEAWSLSGTLSRPAETHSPSDDGLGVEETTQSHTEY